MQVLFLRNIKCMKIKCAKKFVWHYLAFHGSTNFLLKALLIERKTKNKCKKDWCIRIWIHFDEGIKEYKVEWSINAMWLMRILRERDSKEDFKSFTFIKSSLKRYYERSSSRKTFFRNSRRHLIEINSRHISKWCLRENVIKVN